MLNALQLSQTQLTTILTFARLLAAYVSTDAHTNGRQRASHLHREKKRPNLAPMRYLVSEKYCDRRPDIEDRIVRIARATLARNKHLRSRTPHYSSLVSPRPRIARGSFSSFLFASLSGDISLPLPLSNLKPFPRSRL